MLFLPYLKEVCGDEKWVENGRRVLELGVITAMGNLRDERPELLLFFGVCRL